MRSFVLLLFICVGASLVPLSCVDPLELPLRGSNDIIVVDGTITNLAEPQIIRLNRSKADPLTGRFGTLPITKATVEVVVDSAQVVVAHETVDGSYQLPSDFKGLVSHAYQLRFTLSDGTRYTSNQQVIPAVPPVGKVYAQFNPKSLSEPLSGFYTAGHDVLIDTKDPADQHNYYRWDWTLYEKQKWCRTCNQGVYSVNNILPHTYISSYYFVSGNDSYENCFTPLPGKRDYDAPHVPAGDWYYDYNCRTQCWEILHNYAVNLFDDLYSNGGLILKRKVAEIPFYQRSACLVDIRQSSLTKDAYRYYQLFQQQTQNTGGLADTPPTALAGNVRNVSADGQPAVGYFTASSVSLIHQWLDRKDTEGIPFGATDPNGPHENEGEDLFYALNLRRPYPEPSPPYTGEREEPKIRLWPNAQRPPTAICVPGDSRTPFKPAGWPD
ncbi:DUF4249 domain-containing protein [Spirosoma arcticum]